MSRIDDTLREELGALLDGALPEERAAELRRRIEADPELGREFDALRRTVEAVRALPSVRAPAELRGRILAATRRRGIAPILRWGVPALAAAAAALLVVLNLPSDRTREAPPSTLEAKRKDDAPRGRLQAPSAPEEEAVPDDSLSREARKTLEVDAPRAEEARREVARDAILGRGEKAAAALQDAPDLKALFKGDRTAYLRALGTRDAKTLGAHFAEIAGTGRALLPATDPVVTSVTVPSEEEARLVAVVLSRRFPVTRARAKGAPAFGSEAGVRVEVETSAEDLGRAVVWLQRLGYVSDRAITAGARVAKEGLAMDEAAEDADAGRKDARKQQATIVLRFPPPPPATPAGDEKK